MESGQVRKETAEACEVLLVDKLSKDALLSSLEGIRAAVRDPLTRNKSMSTIVQLPNHGD